MSSEPRFKTREEYEDWKARREAGVDEAPTFEKDAEASDFYTRAEAKIDDDPKTSYRLFNEFITRFPLDKRCGEASLWIDSLSIRLAADARVELLAAASTGVTPSTSPSTSHLVPGKGLLEGIAGLNLVAGLILGFIFFVLSVDAPNQQGAFLVVLAVACVLQGLLVWAFVQVITTAAADIRSIRRSIEASLKDFGQ